MPQKKIVFITGTTGLIGSYLTNLFLKNGHKVYALARRKENQTAYARVIKVLNFWDEKILKENENNLIVVNGDITKKGLGLDEETQSKIANEVEEIFHCAAATQLSSSLQELAKINIDGTKNVLDFGCICSETGVLKKINHFSTAYICGNYKGIFKENNLNVGQRFFTTYEQSKFEAEKLIEEYRKKIWIDIFRPAAVIGESTTGKTFQFKHLYELFHVWSLDILDFFPNEDNFSINLTPVDHIANAVYCIFSNINIRNANYHLFGRKPFPTNEIFNIAKDYIGFKQTTLVSLEEFRKLNISSVQKKIIDKTNLFNLSADEKLSSIHTLSILKKYGFNFPDFTPQHLLNILKYVVSSGLVKQKINA